MIMALLNILIGFELEATCVLGFVILGEWLIAYKQATVNIQEVLSGRIWLRNRSNLIVLLKNRLKVIHMWRDRMGVPSKCTIVRVDR
jgi:hypothetical protein